MDASFRLGDIAVFFLRNREADRSKVSRLLETLVYTKMFSRNLSEFNDSNVLGGQTYALASNLQAGVATNSIPTQMQIRSLAPNAAAVVNQLNANQMQQVRAAGLQQTRVQGKKLIFPQDRDVFRILASI